MLKKFTLVVLDGMLVSVHSFDSHIQNLKVTGENAWKI